MEHAVAEPDAAKVFQVHLLDMGAKKYGDCIVCRIGAKVILIDGGHPGDQTRSHPDYRSIPEQLEEILDKPSPWQVDLLVVTHTHQDHIGCLPHLVAHGQLTAKWVLAADEELGWGEVEGVDAPLLADAPQPVRQVFALLREEAPSFASPAELEAFASDAVKMRDRYTAMLKKLKDGGATVVRYGKDDPAALVTAFKSTGLKILGPTREHLKACALEIASLGRDAADAAAARLEQDVSLDVAALYQEIRGEREDAAGADSEAFSIGAAINDQSVVLSFESPGRRVLLTGDMQFADPGFQSLEASMGKLRQKVAKAPYDLVKLAHHGARNAVDADFLAESQANLFLISGGYGSSKHPHPSTLTTLTSTPDITWYRTDRNGLISVDLAAQDLEVEWERGETNESGKNQDAKDFLAEEEAPAPAGQEPAPEAPQLAVASPPAGSAAPASGEFVEVTTRIPHRRTKVVITIEVDPPAAVAPPLPTVPSKPRRAEDSQPPSPPGAAAAVGAATSDGLRIGGGRDDLPPLLFATDPKALVDNLGREEARAVCKALEDSGHTVVFDDFRKMAPSKAGVQIRTALDSATVKGIVLVGGYDVIPPDSVDVLSAAHRRAVDPRYDPDRFLVWSDDFYGDLDDDDFPELPVSRIPDGRFAPLLRTALAATLVRPPKRRAGLRNLKRPFAEDIYSGLPGDAPLLISHPTTAQSIEQEYFASEAIYLMLHGRASNARMFLGATEEEELTEAFDLRNIRPCPGAVVFTGCCWGALIVETTAWSHNLGDGFAPRAPESSLALAFLNSGANAFVGCTGVHYSPRIAPYEYASGPLHRAFWKHLTTDGLRPAEALLAAKRTYLKGMPYPNPIPGEDPGPAAAAVEKKLLCQFTCLGLGW